MLRCVLENREIFFYELSKGLRAKGSEEERSEDRKSMNVSSSSLRKFLENSSKIIVKISTRPSVDRSFLFQGKILFIHGKALRNLATHSRPRSAIDPLTSVFRRSTGPISTTLSGSRRFRVPRKYSRFHQRSFRGSRASNAWSTSGGAKDLA